MPRAWSFVSVLLPQSRMMRPGCFETTVASTVSAQSSSAAAPSATCVRSKYDVVARPQLGDAGLSGAEAQRRRRADRDLVERDLDDELGPHVHDVIRRVPISSSWKPLGLPRRAARR